MAALDPAPLPRRYERARPGELLHIDSKKLARIERTGHRVTGDRRDHVRGAGWEAAFVAIDDRSRVGFAEMFADTGRPAYHAAILLKIYIYGYLNRIASSRRLERKAQRNVELMWLAGWRPTSRPSPTFAETMAKRFEGSAASSSS